MALFGWGTHFLLFLWFSGVDHWVQPSTETGGLGTSPGTYSGEGQEEVPLEPLLLPLTGEESYQAYPPPHYPDSPLFNGLTLPPSHVDPLEPEPLMLRRQYRLEDFLWTGSGDGPHASEQDGGLAWEDNGGNLPYAPGPRGASSRDPQKNWVRVTKTMTLYRTVLTTIYPVEVTPTIMLSGGGVGPTPTPSPGPSPTPSLPDGRGGALISVGVTDTDDSGGHESTFLWPPTPTFPSAAPPKPTAYPLPTSTTSEMPPVDKNVVEESVAAKAASSDPVYWIQTSIRANNSAYRETPRVFQQNMQKNLARVYASAFKRHLLSTLGVLSPSPANSRTSNRRRRSRSRVRRWSSHPEGEPSRSHSLYPLRNPEDTDNADPQGPLQWLYIAQSSMSPAQLQHLATTAMNVTVTILNVTEEVPPKVDLRYIVLAEGSPVPGFSAVKELELVTKPEMEWELGYEIINKKAEALVAGPPEHMTRNEQFVSTSPWLIVAITTICLLVILLALIVFMVWKWKHNRLGDANGGGMGRRAVGVGSSAAHHHHHQTPGVRPQSGITDHLDDDDDELGGGEHDDPDDDDDDEQGVINPAFQSTPKRTGRGGTLDPSPRSSPASQSLLSARARVKTATQRISEVITGKMGASGNVGRGKSGTNGRGMEEAAEQVEVVREREPVKMKREHLWHSPSSSEDLRVHRKGAQSGVTGRTSSEGSADWKELLSDPKPKMCVGSGRKRSPVRGGPGKSGGGPKSGMSATTSKEMLRRRRKKSRFAEEANLRTDFEGEEDDDDDEEEDHGEEILPVGLGRGQSVPSSGKQQQPWSKGLADAISLGNLDIFQDSVVAQTPSEYARKLVPWKRPSSAVGASTPPSSISSSSQPYFLPSTLVESSGGRGGTPGEGGRSTAVPSSRSIQTIQEIPSFDQQDRELSERSESPIGAGPPVNTKEAGVQTPTRISKTASHKQRASAKPRKSWGGSPGGGESSVISTESEEIVEVHHVGGQAPEGENPLGRMRKRFHQFLDDAFNVMGGRPPSDDEDIPATAGGGLESRQRHSRSRKGGRGGETQSAKVSISHEVVETETEWRPWTSHVIREESLQKLRRGGRPKSAAVPAQIVGPPKRAWTASSERRTHSAKQPSSSPSRGNSMLDILQQAGGDRGNLFCPGPTSSIGGMRRHRHIQNRETEEIDGEEDSHDKSSNRQDPPVPSKRPPGISSSAATTSGMNPESSTSLSHSQSVILSPAFIFPQYPTYPDIRVTTLTGGGDPPSTTSTGSSSTLSQKSSSFHPIPPPPPLPTLLPNDPAVPLIQAIKDEMKRFEKEPSARDSASSSGGPAPGV